MIKINIMKNLKILLPMLAFIFAIGVAFATVDLKPEPEPKILANDYVLIDGSWEAIPEQNCTIGSKTCRVQFGEGGPIYDVYDLMSTSSKKKNTTDEPTVIPPPF